MGTFDAYKRDVVDRLYDLPRYYMLSDNSASEDCLSKTALLTIARTGQRHLFEDSHIPNCPRCTSLFSAFKHVALSDTVRPSFAVAIACDPVAFLREIDNTSVQLLGHISLESPKFEVTRNDDDWHSKLGSVRVNLVFDEEADLFSVSVLDVPESIERLSVKSPHWDLELAPSFPDGTYELLISVSELGHLDHTIHQLADLMLSGLAIAFSMTSRRMAADCVEARIICLLQEAGAIEKEFDYVLPSGMHCDTHVNMSRVCHSSVAISRIAQVFDELNPEEFDVIVTNGWPLAIIARRIAAIRNGRNPRAKVREILHEGYDDPLPVEEIPAGSRVLIVTDVTITGRLLLRLTEKVRSFGAEVVAMSSVVIAKHRDAKPPTNLRGLCRIPMRLSASGRTRALEWREKRYFNPLTNCMTERKEEGRSPSEFYDRDSNARLLWGFLEDVVQRTNDLSRFYRHHKIVGTTHYTEYIDTLELLNEELASKAILETIRDILAAGHVVPEILLIPVRKRALLFATLLQESYEVTQKAPLDIVAARKSRAGWTLSPQYWNGLTGRHVLVVDTAVGHGKTLDQLALLAEEYCAKSVSAAVILSRLSESCEDALNDRLSGRFHRIFNLPIRPVVIRGAARFLCPVCQQRAAIETIADDTRNEAIERLAQHRFAPASVRSVEHSKVESRKTVEQKTLFPSSDPRFVGRCRPAIARGLTLHSLYAAKNNGMAPLSLPELLANDVPVKNKEAMVQNLPSGALSWSAGFLDQDLNDCLAQGTHGSVWSASAFVCASEGRPVWREHLAEMIERTPSLRTRPQTRFWSRVACSAYLAVKDNSALAEQVKYELGELAKAHRGTEAARGISRVIETMNSISAPE